MVKSKCITLPNQLIVMGIKELSKDKFIPIQNKENFNKPHGGLWTCPYHPTEKYVSAWQEWCHCEQPNWLSDDAVIITLKEDAMYYCIDDQDDLQDLVDIVGEQKSQLEEISLFKFSTYINFEEARKTFDAIYLTEDGQWNTRIPDTRHYLNLYGWDCESVLLTNFDCIEKWEYIKLNNNFEEEK